jgi:uncharacterized protein YbaP (TraB family)
VTTLDTLKTSTLALGRRLMGTAAAAALGLGLGLAVIAGAPAPVMAQDAAAETGKPALWVLRDADSTIYLFGTVHLLRPETVWNSPVVDQAFASADQIWFEIENPDDQAAAQPLVMRYGIDMETPLSSRLNAEEQAQLNTAAEAMGLTGAALDPMRPWLAALTLSIAPLTKAGYDPESGVELVLRARALEAGKPIDGLETIEEQLQILAGMSEDAQMDFLRSVLSDYEAATVELDRLVDAWAVGDVETLEAIGVTQMRAEGEEFYQNLLVKRNANWAGQIDTMMDGEGVIFIAVGAAHLAGDDSVQALLEQRGFTVERVQ